VAEEGVIPPVLTREMGLTVKEFLRTLPAAVAPCAHHVDGHRVMIRCASAEIHIQLTPLPPRRLAALTLPITRVAFDFGALDTEARIRFMQRFDRHYQRGGG